MISISFIRGCNEVKQKLTIGQGKNYLYLEINNKTVFDGVATHIIDDGYNISFKDKDGKQHEYVKQPMIPSI